MAGNTCSESACHPFVKIIRPGAGWLLQCSGYKAFEAFKPGFCRQSMKIGLEREGEIALHAVDCSIALYCAQVAAKQPAGQVAGIGVAQVQQMACLVKGEPVNNR